MSKIDLGVLVGRFQFFHNGHLDAIRQALKKVSFLLILPGSANKPRTYYNPFTAWERAEVIDASLTEDERARVLILPLNDSTYNNTAWIQSVHEAAGRALRHFNLPDSSTIGLCGFKKDGTSYYLNMFPRWAEVEVCDTTGLSATPFRGLYFIEGLLPDPSEVPVSLLGFLLRFQESSDYTRLVLEYKFIQDYRRPYAGLPYPPVFVTVDACVVQSGYVLLVRRRAMPGKGLWALPGGFLEGTARIEDWIYKELEQETKIAVPEAVLRDRAQLVRVYDDPHRSARGRTITHCALITLEPPARRSGRRSELPRVRGADDADRAGWFPLRGPGSIPSDQMFEDHYSIIQDLTAGL